MFSSEISQKSNKPEWGALSFTYAKPKTNQVFFINNLINFSRQWQKMDQTIKLLYGTDENVKTLEYDQ